MVETEIEILKPAREALAGILAALPGAKLDWDMYARSDQPHLAKMVDFTVTVTTNNRQHTLAVEFKNQGHPRQLREAVDQLLRFHHRANRADYLVVAAPFITAEGAKVCQEENVGYYDLAGNCRLVFGDTYIERNGMPNLLRGDQPTVTPNLYGPKGERVLRILFSGYEKPWKVVPLAEKANVSTGTVSIVRNLLLEREWAQETEAGLKLTQPKRLLKDWATVWARRRVRPKTYFTLTPLADAERQMADFARQQKRPFALTGTAGAWRIAPMVKYVRTQVYWDGDAAELAQGIGLKPAEAGANVQIMPPRDESVFLDQEIIDGVPVVSPLQLYLDLQREPARGEEAAEHLWQTKLFPGDAKAE
jgi:hypothetical protein